MNFRLLIDLSKAAVSGWKQDFAPSMGAALASYTVFSIAPLLIIAIAIVAIVAVWGRSETLFFGTSRMDVALACVAAVLALCAVWLSGIVWGGVKSWRSDTSSTLRTS